MPAIVIYDTVGAGKAQSTQRNFLGVVSPALMFQAASFMQTAGQPE